MGIFECDFDAKLFMEGTVTDVEEATHGDDAVSSASPAPYGDTVVPLSPVDAITAHHIWVGFFLQTWQVSLQLWYLLVAEPPRCSHAPLQPANRLWYCKLLSFSGLHRIIAENSKAVQAHIRLG